jgi:DNA-binding NarL/FixJ family response regulator
VTSDSGSGGAPEITCLIVDDHEVVREGLRLSLSRAPHIRVIGEASDGASAVSLAERRKPHVVIMDVRMPGMDGLEATKELSVKVPESSVLIFTAYSERRRQGLHPQGSPASDARAGDREDRGG